MTLNLIQKSHNTFGTFFLSLSPFFASFSYSFSQVEDGEFDEDESDFGESDEDAHGRYSDEDDVNEIEDSGEESEEERGVRGKRAPFAIPVRKPSKPSEASEEERSARGKPTPFAAPLRKPKPSEESEEERDVRGKRTPLVPPPSKSKSKSKSSSTPAPSHRKFYSAKSTPNHPVILPKTPQTNKKRNFDLQIAREIYDEFNRRVFGNRLPEDLPIKWSVTLRNTAGYCRYKV